MNQSQHEATVTGRETSLFASDIDTHEATLREAISGARIAVVGAAGSVGSAVVKTLLRFQPAALSLIDISENNLVELVRDLRSSDHVSMPDAFETLPIALGTVEFDRYFKDTEPFDYFFNLSAIKHVRSEKNIHCLMRMLDTNAVHFHDFLQENPYTFRKVFSVSSDKAANPANLMGASKMVMEKVLSAASDRQPYSTARFANVAFSDGSLPFGFLHRIRKHQPLSAPEDVRRYFISHEEAGELCVLSCMLGENRDIFFPKLSTGHHEKTFAQIAIDLLQSLGYETVTCASEDEARRRIPELVPHGQWPCYFFKTDTSGEKGFEEFFTTGEEIDLDRFAQVGVIKSAPLSERAPLEAFLAFCRDAKTDANVTKDDYVRAMRQVVPTLQHVETGKNLDQKM